MRPLDDYTTIIRSGVTPAAEGTGQLSPERARQLDADLRALRDHRAHAWIACRSYVVGERGQGDG